MTVSSKLRCAALALVSVGLLAAGCSSPIRSAEGTSPSSSVGHGSASSTSRPGGASPGPGSSTPPVTSVSSPPAHLSWHTCDGEFLCSRLPVPISYQRPGAGSLDLAVIELPSTGDPATARDIVTNPGGPGVSGVSFLEEAYTAFPGALRQEFNIVSFDPRGVGESDPVNCETAAGLRQWIGFDPTPGTPSQITAAESEAKAFDGRCATSEPRAVLASLSTATTARDLDRLRAALGEQKLDYLGFSYGTYLGALYAEAFPGRVGDLVLDGALDPSLGSAAIGMQQAAAFEVDLHDFFAWCPGNASCSSELPDPARDFAELIADVKQRGIPAELAPALGGNQLATYATVLTGVLSALYSVNTWPELAEGISQASEGNATILTEIAWSYSGINGNGTVSNLVSAEFAVVCLDRPVPPVSAYPALAREYTRVAPDFGAAEAWSTLPCDYWPVHATGEPLVIRLPHAVHVLVVGSTHDPATPYAWAKALTRQLPGAVLLTRTGDGHTGYFSSSCVEGWVDAFLATSKPPPPGTVCASN